MMLRSVKELEGLRIGASDGAIGNVKDFYFDDASWVIRYVIADTGSWLGGRDVLLSPYSFGAPDFAGRLLPVSITKERVHNSPSIDIHQPVSRQHEMDYLDYYGYPYYWAGAGIWGAGAYPGAMMEGVGVTGPYFADARATAGDRGDDPHLRSCNAVKGYHVHASDGEIGHVQGYLVNERSWTIQYLVVNTSNWWLGHQVLVAPDWVQDVSWESSKVNVGLSRDQVKQSPAYDPAAGMSRESEETLYRHYGRTAYWRTGDARAAA